MLMVKLLGFFSIFRKHNMRCRKPWAGVFYRGITARYLALALVFALACPAAMLSASQARAASASEDEPGQPYIGRDEQGNRIFGTDDKSEAGFRTDPETGGRTFKTAPPKKEENTWEGPQNIFVTPDINIGSGGTPSRPLPPPRPRQ